MASNSESLQHEALSRAVSGQSVMNYKDIFEGFAAKGIPMDAILPRENVFTYNAWRALADQLQADVHFIPSQQCNVETVQQTWRLCWNIPLFGPSGWHVIIADESDAMSNAAQLALLSKLDSTSPAPQTIWIFTANDCERLEKRFLSRCRVLEFSSYGMRADLAKYLAEVWKAETGKEGSVDFERIAKDSTNNVRDALNTLEVELLAA